MITTKPNFHWRFSFFIFCCVLILTSCETYKTQLGNHIKEQSDSIYKSEKEQEILNSISEKEENIHNHSFEPTIEIDKLLTQTYSDNETDNDQPTQSTNNEKLFDEDDDPMINNLVCNTPKSIMLHSWFGVEQMELLSKAIIENDYITITYNQLYDYWDNGQCPPNNSIIVSLDDLSGVYLRKIYTEMIDVFKENNLVLTLGIITQCDNVPQDQDIWKYYQYLDKVGFEIASHSKSHRNLPTLSLAEIEDELTTSYNIICEHLNKCPNTFILPYGNGWNDKRVVSAAQDRYRSIISISGPDNFYGDLFILRRISPHPSNQDITIKLLEAEFP